MRVVIVIALAAAGYAVGTHGDDGLRLALACRDGNARACDDAQHYAADYGDYELYELDATCMLDANGFACEELAGALRSDDDANPAMRPIARSRMARALDLFVTGCASGRADSCFGASRVYGAGFGVPWNELASRTYGATACELGVTAACEREGDRSAGADAIGLYRRACPSSPHACTKLARAEQAAGLASAEHSFRIACEHLAFDACAHIASSIDRLDGESPAIAVAFARWCDDGDGDTRACSLVRR